MRKPSFVDSFKTVLMVVPLLASCGGSVNTSPAVIVGPDGLLLPDCQEGQLVGVNPDKTLTCVSALSGMLSPPNCTPGTQALTSLKDTVTGMNVLTCVNKGNGSNDVTTSTRITNATMNINMLQTTVSTITAGGGTRSKYLGPSKSSTTGQIFANANAQQGGRAVSTICNADFGTTGAHMCTPFEIYESLVIGDVLNQASANVGPLQVYMQSWTRPFDTGTDSPTAGLNENCGAQTYKTADRRWHNTFFSFSAPSGSTTKVAKFDQSPPCGTVAFIACCK